LLLFLVIIKRRTKLKFSLIFELKIFFKLIKITAN
jgi:hypothetical protein